jgi:flagellar secretion chaperone FliS
MSYASQADRYREAQIHSATPSQLLLIVFDYLSTNINRARIALERDDLELRVHALDRARQAVGELICTLDEERGGALARQLMALYAFLLGELMSITGKADIPRLERLGQMVLELRQAFDGAANAGRLVS